MQFGGSDTSDSGDDSLPFPQPLSRAAFLTPDFDPNTFLSSLHNRHQTLEDLRSELQARSQEINKELLDLVNENYQDFLSLGSSLHGGDEKVEEVRLGLLGFKRDVESLKGKVDERKQEVEVLVKERKEIRKDIQTGRALLHMNQRLQELEQRLMISSDGADKHAKDDGDAYEPSESEEESDGEYQGSMPTSRLQRHVQLYSYIKQMVAHIGPDHPYLINQEERILRLKQTILLDLGGALKQTSAAGVVAQGRLMKLLTIYKDMGEYSEASEILKEQKSLKIV
ncbi:MAG: hypothetical protein Q9214_003972 [Letrouitia sp. 1 TL-2023]